MDFVNKSLRYPLLALSTLFPASAMASSSIADTHFFRLGAYSQDADVKLTSSVVPLPPIEVDLIKDLGTEDSNTSIYALYRWHFTQKWSVSVAYQQLELDGNDTVTANFNFDGNVFISGFAAKTEFNMSTYLIDVGYSFVRNDKWEVMLGLGLHAFDIESIIDGQASVSDGNNNIIQEETRVSSDVLAPLPNLRGAVTYMISPKWEVNVSVGWLSLEIDEVDGSYVYVDLGTEYRFTDHFGVGATYQVAEIEATVTKNDGFEKADLKFTGPSIYISYGF